MSKIICICGKEIQAEDDDIDKAITNNDLILCETCTKNNSEAFFFSGKVAYRFETRERWEAFYAKYRYKIKWCGGDELEENDFDAFFDDEDDDDCVDTDFEDGRRMLFKANVQYYKEYENKIIVLF